MGNKDYDDHPLNSKKGAVIGCIIVLICVAVIIIAVVVTKTDHRSPILYFPEKAHLYLEARVQNAIGPCPTIASWTKVAIENGTSSAWQPCYQYILGMQYNSATGQYVNNPGVETRVLPGFDGVLGLEDNAMHSLLVFFQNLGFIRGINLKANPYDWRLTPDRMPTFVNDTKAIVEFMHTMGNGTNKVTLVGHSTGASVALYFLQQMSQTWKDTYIHTFVALGGNLAGSAVCVNRLVAGPELPSGWNVESYRDTVTRTAPSESWCLPRSTAVYGSLPVAQINNMNYTAATMADFLAAANLPAVADTYNRVVNVSTMNTYPGVNTFCWYGQHLSSPWGYFYTTPAVSAPFQTIYGDGDGSHDLLTLQACQLWSRTQLTDVGKVVKIRGFAGVSHHDLPANADVQNAIAFLLLS
eukprot:TRINITY_DN5868_c1_g1_i1.p1 TRINITY_DN5868_c1_g1~~TRINITY_DN5868_c1_g1_i1.p1  ORF type:complete len:424 (+),score=71.78 TRINITY_DN5868_c1_g1_i1:38-1273(+)